MCNLSKEYYVYIMASKRDGVLYIGVTNDLYRRVLEHKSNVVRSFTQRYFVHRLVYFEQTEDIYSAIAREKQLKNWKRDWKIKLIERCNPEWKDLYNDL